MERETLDFDIVFAGAGPANLAAALHLQHLVEQHNGHCAGTRLEAEIAVLEKGRSPGGHLLSGAILDPAVMQKFMPDYREQGFPDASPVSRESVWFLSERRKFALPYLPEPFRNDGNLIVSLSEIGAWMQRLAEERGIPVLDSTAAVSPVIHDGCVTGVITDDKGRDRDGRLKSGAEPGMQLNTRALVVGEGARGSLFRQLDREFGLQPPDAGQTYETGVKEVWRIAEGRVQAGEIHHTFGYPLPPAVYGGGWMYALSAREVSLGFVTSAEPGNPVIDPHWNLQLFKEHPLVRSILEDGEMIEYGAKAITSGGYDAMPKLSGPGFLLTGETAGMLNMQRLKGIHLAVQSGMMAAETLFEALKHDDFSPSRLSSYEERFARSAAHDELHNARDYRRNFDQGLYKGLIKSGLKLAVPGILNARSISSPKPPVPGTRAYETFTRKRSSFRPDGKLTFSREDDLYRSTTLHEEDQPCHLKISPADIRDICAGRCREEFGNPCTCFCPAGVYEIDHEHDPVLRINASNCLHCKTCDIADPYGIITWTPPEGGGGPAYKQS
ncbi:MAG: electron transfer flavoprotein-ubiquinone oxidoreductase [Prosthecochloris sp.]|nr:electron transfer flavoprotein-ubiquinone oxidoreductase [Prosthecochloris sp.]